jgi:PAS domain S-box-containing protein
MDSLTQFFAVRGFMPHGYCFQWTPQLLWTYVVSDGVIALSYYSIPVALWTFVRRRADLPFSWVFLLFAAFIVACGSTHLVGIWNIWQPVYWLDAGLKALTAGVSVVTAVLLWPSLPRALALPSPARLQAVNHELQQEIATRQRLEEELQALNQQLEQRVGERTSELAAANAELRRRDDEREQAARVLLETRHLLDSVVDNAAAVIYVKRLDGRYLLVNRRFQELFHVTQAAMLERTDHDLFPPDHADAFRRVDQHVALSGETVHAEEVAPLDDGEHSYISVKFPVRDAQDRVYAIGGISTDITELKRRDAELERSNAELEQFAYVASHDLQEPLRMVANYTELLAQRYRGQLDEKADKYIHYACDGARRMQRLVSDLLAYSRVGSQGKALLPVDAAKVLARVLESLQRLVRETGASIECGGLPTVLADEGQLSQLFQNLLSNALKFRSEAPPRIVVAAVPAGPRWQFSVADNGIGLDMRFAERIFQMFQRLHELGRYEGSGIGLAIAKRIVERHGGTISVESQPGAGTTFRFSLAAAKDMLKGDTLKGPS